MSGPEKKFEIQLKKWLKKKNIYYFKYHGNMYSQNGVADLTLCVNGKFVACEVKSDKGKTSKVQDINLKQVESSGGVAIIVRPCTFEIFKNQIERLLND